jgi:subtilisin family serine protease
MPRMVKARVYWARRLRLISAMLWVLLPACSQESASPRPVVQPELWEAFADRDQVEVMVSFEDPAPSRLLEDPEGHRQAISALSEALLSAGGFGFTPTRRFAHLPAMAGSLSSQALARLARLAEVSFIQTDSPGHGALTVAVPAIGGDVAKRDYHVTGKGVRVAVLDTGINTTHPDLSSSLVSTQHCFTRGACPPNNTAEGTSAEDDHGHGSHVAGIITSDGKVAGVGFAPDAEIVAIKVNDRDDSGFASDWAAGMDWLFTNLATLKVKVVNASVGTAQLYGSTSECDRGEPALSRAVSNLVSAGVTVFASAGNAGSTTKVSAPACNTGAIAVGATYKSNQGRQPTKGTYSGQWGRSFADCADEATVFDQVACFSNSGPRVDIMAPGAVVVSDVLQGKTSTFRGTSQASPAAAGVAALMLECNPRLTPAEIKDILIRTSSTVTDKKNNATFPSIRAAAAVKAACGSASDAGVADAEAIDASLPDLANRYDGRGALDQVARDSADVGAGGASALGGSSGNAGTTGTGGATGGSSSTQTSQPLQGGASTIASTSRSSSAAAGSAAGAGGATNAGSAGTATTGSNKGGTPGTSSTVTSVSSGIGGSSTTPKPTSSSSGCQCDLSPHSSAPSSALLLVLLLLRRFRCPFRKRSTRPRLRLLPRVSIR